MPRSSIIGICKEKSRGRPKGMSKFSESSLISILLIARKHNLDPKLLLGAFVKAWKNKMHHCGSLKVSCRGVDDDSAFFLITHEENEGEEDMVSQFRLKLEVLKNPGSFNNFLKSFNSFLRDLPRFDSKKKQKKICELRVGMKKVDVKAKIVEIPPANAVVSRWGSQSSVCNVVITDGSGSIRLCLWNKQIGKVHVGDKVELMNCYVSSFLGIPQLRLGKKGEMLVTQPFLK